MQIPQLHAQLTEEHLNFLKSFTKSCRRSILQMVTGAQSGHPGGSLSSIDFLSIVYAFIISQTGNPIVISNGHISPAVYSILGEMGYVDKKEAIETFRKLNSHFEGHVCRHVPGVWYGTGPLGIGVSVAAAFAHAQKLKSTNQKVFCEFGDGEAQEGQIHEMIHYAKKYKLDNLILFVDYNDVQLSASLKEIMPIDIVALFKAGGFEVFEANGHNFQEIWTALSKAYEVTGKPVLIATKTVMGEGVEFMQVEGEAKRATWHGKAPSHEAAAEALAKIELTPEELSAIEQFKPLIKWNPSEPEFIRPLTKLDSVNPGAKTTYPAGTVTDCRSAYGHALLDLATHNQNVLALTADLRDSVKTDGVHKSFPDRHLEVGIAEQHMVSLSGGLSLAGYIPFCSTFGAFMSSRAKDQARVNDINQTNVKMVATHCGLSVGEDGPTHQVIDDMGSFLGMFNTHVIEPADANQCDRIIRYICQHYGNFYVRMGRHKFPVLLKENGTLFYDENYDFQYGKSDTIRTGQDITVIAGGSCVSEAVKARDELVAEGFAKSVEVIALSSLKHIDNNILESIRKTNNVITVEDHNTFSGIGSQVARALAVHKIPVDNFKMMGVEKYQFSGTADLLYAAEGLDANAIKQAIKA